MRHLGPPNHVSLVVRWGHFHPNYPKVLQSPRLYPLNTDVCMRMCEVINTGNVCDVCCDNASDNVCSLNDLLHVSAALIWKRMGMYGNLMTISCRDSDPRPFKTTCRLLGAGFKGT